MKNIYCIEGNIGAGKSTLMNYLQAKFFCFPEPLSEWTLLENFYVDQKTFKFPFQYQVLISQFNLKRKLAKISPCEHVFVERCPWTSRNIFLDEENFSHSELEVYENFYKLCKFPIKKMFFLKLSPETCFQRIKLRNRFEERNITLDYIKKLDNLYCTQLKKAPFKVEYINVENGETSENIYNKVLSLIQTQK